MRLSNTTSILMGIDPGYDRIGWAICENNGAKLRSLGYGCIRTNSKETQLQRYQQLAVELGQILDQYHPDAAVVESLFFATNQKTAIAVAQARGIILAQLFQHQVAIHQYTPLQIKQATTGYGSADKASVEKMVRLQIELPSTKIIDDTIDALAMVITLQARLRVDAASML
ncbi:crossover junction endodeoxyribonuclease RuvC [Candidatus Woesebacteria bacterium]|nr:crossover junction endodeoxyribonuclease RuvC [Candidatus Woesebacteria bacterium]